MLTQTNNSVLLPQYNNNLIRALLGLRFESRKLPELASGEVLVEMAYSPCNPSDIAFLRGGYNIVKALPTVPGFEASGTVVGTASDVAHMMGKRVSCFTQDNHDGTWASHFITRAEHCIQLKDAMDMQQAACLSINPLTAMGMYELVAEKKCSAIILNAAGGQVPRLMTRLAERDKISVIRIVRKKDQAEQMKKSGSGYVLDNSDEDFEKELSELCSQLKPTIAFDAVGGELSGKIVKAMPMNAELVVYGALANDQLNALNAMDIIFKGKGVRGFNLNTWIASMDAQGFKEKTDEIQDLIIRGIWHTQIQAVFSLQEVVQGIRTYIQSMSNGKVLFKP